MRNIIIAGAARSGKSILARRLASQCGYSYLPLDALVETLKSQGSESGIIDRDISYDEYDAVRGKIAPLLCAFMENIRYITKSRYIFDTHFLLPEDVVKYLDIAQYEVIFTGYSKTDHVTKTGDIRDYAEYEGCWTAGTKWCDTVELLESFVAEQIALSQKIERQCSTHALLYVDVSHNFRKVIHDTVERILLALDGKPLSLMEKIRLRLCRILK